MNRFFATRKLKPRVAALLTVVCVALIGGCESLDDARPVSQPPDPVHVEFSDGDVTIKAHDAPVRDLLIEIARQSQLELLLQDALRERVTVEFHGVPLAAAVGRLLHDRSFALHYVSSSERPAIDAPPNRLWVFAHTTREPGAGAPAPSDEQQSTKLTFDLAHESTEVRLGAVYGLSNLNDDQALNAVNTAALHDWDAAVRTEALHALGELGGDGALPILEQALHDPAREVRRAAIGAIADIGGEASLPALASALQSADGEVRADAVDALGEIGGEGVTSLLRQALADEQPSVRAAAAEHLSDLQASRAVEAPVEAVHDVVHVVH